MLESALTAVVVLALLCPLAHAQMPEVGGSWSTSVYVPEPANQLPPADLTDATLRQVVHLSIGGGAVRVHFSNAYGTAPLHITSAHVARPLASGSAKIDPATDRALTFSGRPDVTIPAGAEWISDSVTFSAAPTSDLAISLRFEQPPSRQTGHPGARATTFYTHGDLTAAPDLPGAKTTQHWYTISAVDTYGFAAGSIVAFGDSITDGHGATLDKNDRWPDVLAQRISGAGQDHGLFFGVLNQGIGGNHMLTDGLGPSALARFDHDLLAQSGVRYAILLEGINDLGKLARETPPAASAEHTALVHDLIASYQQFITRAHAHGIRVIGATVTPDGGSDYYHPAAIDEADRQAVNAWIRAAGHFDGVVDFDQVLADPANPTHLLPAYDSGDHLHPSPAGYRAMGNAIPLTLFR